MVIKQHEIRVAQIRQILFSLGHIASLFLPWALFNWLPRRFHVNQLTGMAVMSEALPFAILPLIGVIIVPVLTSVKNIKEPSLRWFLHLLKVFLAPLTGLIATLTLLDLGRIDGYYSAFYLFFASLAGIFLIALYGCFADFREFKDCLKNARDERPDRIHLKITSGVGGNAISRPDSFQ